MAFITKLLIAISLIAVAQAGFSSSYASSGTGAQQGNGYVFNPFAAAGFSNFPNFPAFHYPHIYVPSPDEIKNVKPKPGQNYEGISVSSSSHISTDADGNVIKKGGTTVLTNDNGEVHEYTVGDHGDVEKTNSPPMPEFVMPEMPKFVKPKFPKFKPFKHHTYMHHVFEPITFKPFVFEPIVFKPIKPINPEVIRNRKPGDNEHFVGTHVSSFSHSTNINGVKTSDVGSDSIVNNDGVVDEKSIRVGQHDKTEEEMEREKHETECEHEDEREHEHENDHNNEHEHQSEHEHEHDHNNEHEHEHEGEVEDEDD